jgi:hypothetical protein
MQLRLRFPPRSDTMMQFEDDSIQCYKHNIRGVKENIDMEMLCPFLCLPPIAIERLELSCFPLAVLPHIS